MLSNEFLHIPAFGGRHQKKAAAGIGGRHGCAIEPVPRCIRRKHGPCGWYGFHACGPGAEGGHSDAVDVGRPTTGGRNEGECVVCACLKRNLEVYPRAICGKVVDAVAGKGYRAEACAVDQTFRRAVVFGGVVDGNGVEVVFGHVDAFEREFATFAELSDDFVA